MAGSPSSLDTDDDVEQMRKRVQQLLSTSAPTSRQAPSTPPQEDDEVAKMRAQVRKHLGSTDAQLPVKTTRGIDSPIAQRQETLTSGDPFEMNLPEDGASRFPIGGTIGGIAGMVAGAPLGIPGSAALSGLLSAGGEAGQQLIEHLIGSPHAPKTTGEAGKQMLEESALGMLSEVGGRAIGGLVGKVVKRPALAEMEVAQDFVKNGMMFNGKPMAPRGSKFQDLYLTPAELTGGQNYIQTLQNVAEGSFIGKSTIEQFKSGREKFLKNAIDSFTDGLGQQLSSKELGEVIAKEVKGNYQAARAPARAAYQFLTLTTTPKKIPTYTMQPTGIVHANGSPHMVKVQTGETYDTRSGAWVDVRNIKKALEKDADTAALLRGLGAKEGGDDIVSTIRAYPDKIPYFAAQVMRTRLQSLGDVFSIENKKAPALGIINKMSGMVDQQIANGLKSFSQDAHDIWRYANQIYRGANEDFNNEFLRSILKKVDRKDLPETVMSSLLQPQKYSDLAKVKTAVGPDTWSTIQRSGLQRMTELATKDGVIQPHLLEQQLWGPKGLGKEKLDVLFSQDQQHWMREFVNAAHATMKKGDTTGKMAIQLAQPAAMIGVGAGLFGGVSAAVPASSIAILATPPMLAQILTSPTMSKMFVQGMRTPATHPSAAGIVARLLNMVTPRSKESPDTPRTSERHLPSSRDIYPGVDLP